MKPGDPVRVVLINADEFEEAAVVAKYVGKVGTIIRRVVDQAGASPNDPAWLVAFHGLGRDIFWTEELARVRPC